MNSKIPPKPAAMAFSPLLPARCSTAAIESGVTLCDVCDGFGEYGLRVGTPRGWEGVIVKCEKCGGTGAIEKAKPQSNEKLTHD